MLHIRGDDEATEKVEGDNEPTKEVKGKMQPAHQSCLIRKIIASDAGRGKQQVPI